jgi:hypothetical protein
VKSRGPYFAFGDTTLGQGVNKTIDFLAGNQEVLDKIAESCYNVVGVQYPPVKVEQRKEVDERDNQD